MGYESLAVICPHCKKVATVFVEVANEETCESRVECQNCKMYFIIKTTAWVDYEILAGDD